MAEPDVERRLEEIEARNTGLCDPVCPTMDVRYLLRLTRALLASQGELAGALKSALSPKTALGRKVLIERAAEAIARAEAICKGEV